MDLNTIIQGHVLEVLSEMPDESIHCIVTSPPYWGLRDYGLEAQIWDAEPGCEHEWGDETVINRGHPGDKSTLVGTQTADISKAAGSQGQFCLHCNAWRGSLGLEPTPELYVKHIVQIGRELRRVLRKDGTCWLNMGDSYTSGGRTHRRDPDSKNEPALQNFDRIKTPPGLKPKDLCMIPARVALALQADGWWVRSEIIWAKPNPMPESCTDRPTTAHEKVFLLTRAAKYYYDADAVREPHSSAPHTRGQRVYEGRGTVEAGWKKEHTPDPNGRNLRSVWTIATQPFPEAHFATFPEKLIEPCIKAGTSAEGCCPECGAPWERVVEKEFKQARKPWVDHKERDPKTDLASWGSNYGSGTNQTKTTGWQPTCEHKDLKPVPGVVLDPFFGSGTVGVVAHRYGRNFIGIELSPDYIGIADRRLEPVLAQGELF